MDVGKIVDLGLDVVVDLLDAGEELVVGTDHAGEHGYGLFELVVHPGVRVRPGGLGPQLLDADIDQDVVGKVVVLPAPVVQLAGEDLLALHQLEVIDDRLGGDHQGVGDLRDKAGFLPEQLDDTPPVAVPEDVQEPGHLCCIVHVYKMLVGLVFISRQSGF